MCFTDSKQMKEVLTTQAKNVHEKEDYTLRYMMTEQIDTETPDIIMIETCVFASDSSS